MAARFYLRALPAVAQSWRASAVRQAGHNTQRPSCRCGCRGCQRPTLDSVTSVTPVHPRRIERQPAIDLAKAAAAVLIVMHHAVSYGPLGEALAQAWPAFSGWLANYGRYAVQVFLVVGGFLAAQGLLLAPSTPHAPWLRRVGQRYVRLAWPFMAAVSLTLLAHVATAPWVPELLPQDVSVGQWLAHAALLHGVLDQESLTVGAWYVAIDFQLFALLAGLLRAGPRTISLAWRWCAVWLLMALSLWVFNRDAAWDNWALYFWGSYGLGVCVAGLTQAGAQGIRRTARGLGLLLLLAVVMVGLAVEFRGRVALAAGVALLLLVVQHRPLRLTERSQKVWQAAGARSYALFLVHFPVCLLGNAAFVMADGQADSVTLATLILGAVLLGAIAVSDRFYRHVERPFAQWQPILWVQAASGRLQALWRISLLAAGALGVPLAVDWLM